MQSDPMGAIRRVLVDNDGIRLAIVFGSRARASAGPRSDIDLAVDGPGVDLLSLARDLSLAAGVEVDIIELGRAGIPLVVELLRDGVVIHERDPGAGARWRSGAIASTELDLPWFERMQKGFLRRVSERGI